MLYDTSGKTIPGGIDNLSPYCFSLKSLLSLGYPTISNNIIPGHAHFPLFQFFLDRPDYQYYWMIEYDMRFSGEWRLFFESFSKKDADFLSSHIRHYEDDPDWRWWELKHPRESIPLQKRIGSFNPIYRISHSALSFLHEGFKSGWRGHHEVALPTLLHHNGFSLMDICGRGKYAIPGIYNKFYSGSGPDCRGSLSGGSLRYRPVFWRYGREKNKLYHPVKPFTKALHDNLKSRRDAQAKLTGLVNMFRK